MRILIQVPTRIPAYKYGGTNRVAWSLGKELVKKGHEVVFLAPSGSTCDFAEVIELDPSRTLQNQIPAGVDMVHLNQEFEHWPEAPFLFTQHGNFNHFPLPLNTVFVSRRHAERHGSESYVYNGLDWDEYGAVDLQSHRSFFHFLGNAAWRIKNVKGAIDVVRHSRHERLEVLGGYRINFRMGFRLTLSSRVGFHGMVDDVEKVKFLRQSKGLIFPVRWDEPFGLAVIESLYFGCPVFGTPYGALPELVNPDVGVLSTSRSALTAAIEQSSDFSPLRCHEYARDEFNSALMTERYLDRYERILNGQSLNQTEPAMIGGHTRQFLEWKP